MPLFVQDAATARSLLRLSGVPSSATDTNSIIDQALMVARLTFYRRLGQQRIAALLAMPVVAEPDSNTEILRALATTTEIKIATVELMRRLPSAWMDASGDIDKRWNEEAPFRERGPFNANREVQRLLAEIEEDMQLLANDEAVDGTEIKVLTFDGTPDTPGPALGSSLMNRYGRRRAED